MVKKMDQSKKSYSKIDNSKVIKLKKVMNTKNRFEYPNKFFDILKFDMVPYVPKQLKRKIQKKKSKLKLL
jgi:hypothetical protein